MPPISYESKYDSSEGALAVRADLVDDARGDDKTPADACCCDDG